jgi:hypothetical protein
MITTSAQSFIYQIAGDKETANHFCESLILEITEGGINNPERLYAALNDLKKRFEEIQQVIKDECNINPNEVPESFGWKFKQVERGVSYDFKSCNHRLWNDCDTILKSTREQQKEIENTLKSLTKPLTVVDEDSGEVVTVNPPIKKSTTTIEVK